MNNRLKIGQEVLIHGYVDEIRKDTIIIRNDGGYFGTVQEEISVKQEPCEDCVSRQAVLEHICEGKECYKEECKGRTLKRCPDLQWVFDLPSVKPQEPRTDVLDKIKAEIDSYCSDNRDKNDGLYIAMQIIYKYKGGSEG